MYGQCSVMGATLRGVEAFPVHVEVVVSAGLPGFAIVGMADAAVQEARERVKAAIRASGFSLPAEKIVVNLAPAALRKIGSGFDLPIAVALLAAMGYLDKKLTEGRLFVGELSLEGTLRPVTGLLAYALCARDAGLALVCSSDSDTVAIEGLEQFGLRSLSAMLNAQTLDELKPSVPAAYTDPLDFSDVAGHDVAKRALQIAAAGGHGVLMMGPPGSGKTMLASRFASLLPPLTEEEALSTALIHSVAGEPVAPLLARRRPFRKPHHSATLPGLVGGGSPIRPGEVSLAHNGVLFLDELAEFRPMVLQGIRQPMEAGEVRLTRADGNVSFPARFMLIAASNPCPCGYFGDSEHECSCTIPQIRSYQGRIGGPLIDRIDLHLDVERIAPGEVMDTGQGTSSEKLREGVLRARAFASWRRARKGDVNLCRHDGICRNSGESFRGAARNAAETRSPSAIVAACDMSKENREFMERVASLHSMSGRAIMRTLAVARTIADLDESLSVEKVHLAEALGFRVREGVGG